jgi:uncharacterized tellurite resistance protein B-like protein
VASLALIIVADDEVDTEEVVLNRRILETALDRPVPDKAVARLAELAKLNIKVLKDAVKDRGREISYDQKVTILTASAAAILADSKIEASEEYFLHDLAECLGFERTIAAHFLSRAVNKYRKT